MEISFKNNLEQLAKQLDKISTKIVPRAAQQAINRTAKGVKTDAVKAVSKASGIQQKLIRNQIEVNPSRKQTLNASIDSSSAKGKNLIKFVSKGARKPNYFNNRNKLKSGKRGKYKAKGVKAKAWGKNKLYKGTFIGTGKNGATLVFSRASGITSSGKGKLKSIQGPSARQIFKSPRQKLNNSRSASRRFNIEIDRAIKFQLSKLK
jgi:hypothetical protein